MPSPLRILVNLISDAVSKIDEEYAASNIEFPSLNDVFDPKDPANILLSKQNINQNVSIIAAAAEQLVASVRTPVAGLWDMSLMHIRPACLHTVILGGVSEILRAAGPKGLHVQEIAKQNGLEAGRLCSWLFPMCSKRSPPNLTKFNGTDGVAALIESVTDEAMKAGVHLADNLFNPQTGHSFELTDSPLCQLFKTPNTYFGWMDEPGNEYRRNRFHVAMRALQHSEPNDVKGFPWSSLPGGSKIVDVGGGVGSVCLSIAKQIPHLKFVIQDTVTDKTEQFWKDDIPGSIESGKVVVQNHNFFEPQPVRDADIFLLRAVIHNWPTPHAIEILKNLREAAVLGKTRLLLLDQIVQYACTDNKISDIPGADSIAQKVPEPLLPSLGVRFAYTLDLNMLIVLNAQERTLVDQIDLTNQAGWRIIQIHSPAGSGFRHILAEVV